MKSFDDRLHTLVRRTAGALAVEVKALIAAQVRAAADTIAPPPERQGDDALKVTLPNGITVQTESQGDVEALIGWLGMAPAVVLEPLPATSQNAEPLPILPPPPAVEEREVLPRPLGSTTRDHTGARIGSYACVEQLESDGRGARWRFRCDGCGGEKVWRSNLVARHLRVKASPHCGGCRVPKSLGRLLLVGPTEERYYGQVVYLWRCPDCSVEERLPSSSARDRKSPTRCRCTQASGANPAPITGDSRTARANVEPSNEEPKSEPRAHIPHDDDDALNSQASDPPPAATAPPPHAPAPKPPGPPPRATHGLLDASTRAMVRTMAVRIAAQKAASVDLLVEIGNAALEHAERTFNPTHGRAFLVWASLKVREAMLDSVRPAPVLEEDDEEQDEDEEAAE
jgi:hypothetical protein